MKEGSLPRFPFILYFKVILFWVGAFPASQFCQHRKSLYVRLDGYDAISAVVNVFLTKICDDPVVGRFYCGNGN